MANGERCEECGDFEFNGLHPLTDRLRYEVEMLGLRPLGIHPFKVAAVVAQEAE